MSNNPQFKLKSIVATASRFVPRSMLSVALLLAAVFLAGAGTGHAANSELLVAVVKSRQAPVYETALEGFKEVLSADSVRVRYLDLTVEEVKEIEGSSTAMILALGSGALEEAARQTSEIPIVFSAVLAPRDSLPAQSNITGSLLNVSPAGQLKELSEALPRSRRVGVVYVPRENDSLIEAGRRAARELRIELKTFAVEHARDIPQISSMDIDALWLVPNRVTGQLPVVQHLLVNCFRYRVPVMGLSPSYVKAGALLAASPDPRDVGRQAAELALEILKGRSPDRLEPTEPRQLKISVNLAVADKLRLTISQETVNRAAQIFGQ